MSEIAEAIITIGAVVAALLSVVGVIRSVLSYVQRVKENNRALQQRNENQDRDIAKLKEENQLICYGLSAALDGLGQLGANHIVPIAKRKLDEYINEQAHK